MRKTIKLTYFIAFLTIILAANQALAIDESKLANSAEKLIEKWISVLSKDIIVTIEGVDGFWRSSKHVFVGGSEDFKIVRTNLVVPAYHLFIKFKLRWLGTNSHSPYAKPSHREGTTPGFPTFEDSRRHTKESDFGRSETYEYNLKYALVNDKWVLRDYERPNSPIDYETFNSKENKNLFKNLLSVPID